MKLILTSISFLLFSIISAQTETEIMPPFNIKTVSFVENASNVIPIFELGSSFSLQFDDLFGNEADYYYEIIHCDYNWKPSNLYKNDYLLGFDNQRIFTYKNSINTLQIYSHYILPLPNEQMQGLKISGNYILKIFNDAREVVFSRKFMLYDKLANVPMQIKRTRNLNTIEQKQNVEISIQSEQINFQNPLQNVKILIFQNGKVNEAIKNIAPQYTIGNNLLYKYDTETQFFGGNEFLFFENRDIQTAANNISKIDRNSQIYGAYLFTHAALQNQLYSLTNDLNGAFYTLRSNADDPSIEAEYVWVYFSLSAPTFRLNKSIYITGMFNNFQLIEENKMVYNEKNGLYEKALLLKQGFTNYAYTIADDNGKIDNENAIDGNFYQTENEYTTLVYYRDNIGRYDQIIGKGTAKSINLVN